MAGGAVLGEHPRVDGFALAGALVMAADGPEVVREAWGRLPADTGLVIVTPAAAEALGPALLDLPRPLTVVMSP
jgi:vacuolar-type H+-ATPase subunit F/Vma7